MWNAAGGGQDLGLFQEIREKPAPIRAATRAAVTASFSIETRL